ncbi:hypothetical protein FGO68_gene17301 [Halteria grandinella]|uniref:Transmembrane protein n=1 Tax=Halteria grandinella TaxID=5974 RepID=A0A8J8NGF9_HALGN|nr:hypothetical protein FGO68_gene17301 [Halteria grandinella]
MQPEQMEQNDEEVDHYTQMYLKKKQNKKKNQSPSNSDHQVSQRLSTLEANSGHYGLQSVMVNQVMEQQSLGGTQGNLSQSNRRQGKRDKRDKSEALFRTIQTNNVEGVHVQDIDQEDQFERYFTNPNVEEQDEFIGSNFARSPPKVATLITLQSEIEYKTSEIKNSRNANRPFLRTVQSHQNMESQSDISESRMMHTDVPSLSLLQPNSNNHPFREFEQLHLNLKNVIHEATTVKQMPFHKSHFRILLQSTLEQRVLGLGSKKQKNICEEQIQVVKKQKLGIKIGQYLSEQNYINLNNMPFLDMGEKPDGYNPERMEAFQTFLPPKSQYPHNIIIKSGEYKYNFIKKNIPKKFQKSGLIGFEPKELEDTLLKAEEELKPYAGMVVIFDRANFFMIFAGFLLTIIGSAIIGSIYNWLLSLVVILVYLFATSTTYIITKYLQNRYLRQAHFALAIFCRAENNRFLRNGLKLLCMIQLMERLLILLENDTHSLGSPKNQQ